MTPARDNYFLHTISHLREQEEMLIYDRFTSPTVKEEKAVAELLREEYAKEVLNFPGVTPPFEEEAAVWAARIVFNASQLLLSREKDAQDIAALLAPYSGIMTPAVVLSADLCLRCLPDVIAKAREINPDDPLIGLLEDLLQVWHYSGIGYFRMPEGGGRDSITEGGEIGITEGGSWMGFAEGDGGIDCLRLLYIDRVIERKAIALANLPNFGREYWR